ncbi:VrrA/YqfQ family protein [Neobacillus sp. FSL H8-0543]|uniref:VrrA/YqfQ family protein n=1 Tax=Neobacillus sp. FSL H8-0543 TaxID=2954672 RepID=UPI003158661E
MQPRQRFPVQRGMMMRQGQFTGHGQMMGPFGGGGPMMGPPRQYSANPRMGQMMGRSQGRRSGGGLLSKILGGKSTGSQFGGLGGMQAAGRSASSSGGGIGSILKTLSNPNGINGFLNNTQQILQHAQSLGPMIQQYGPLVKNLPAMWRLYKGLKDAPSAETAVESTSKDPEAKESVQSITTGKKKRPKKKTSTQVEAEDNKKQNSHRGSSLPKLYI